MPEPTENQGDGPDGLEIRTYFVRGRNALVARADFGELFVDYYLHAGENGLRLPQAADAMLKEALVAVALHGASRPWNESSAWTLHFEEPLLNLFVACDNRDGSVIGQAFDENIRVGGTNLFLADTVRGSAAARRSSVSFEGTSPFRAAEEYYRRSEQRPARVCQFADEDHVMVTAQPDYDETWFEGLDDRAIRALDGSETLALLERRRCRWKCGCTERRMLEMLAPIMARDPEGLFGDDAVLRIGCPRCGARRVITRETLEAFLAEARPPGGHG
jgi:molecular chaperone Hsp33